MNAQWNWTDILNGYKVDPSAYTVVNPEDVWRRKYERNDFTKRSGKALFMQRTKCPACCINLYVWEKSTEAVCVCGALLRRA